MFKGKIKELVDNALIETQKKQESFVKKFKIKDSFKYTLKKNGIVEAYYRKKLVFTGKYEIIGTYNEKSGFFRNAFSNSNIPKSLSRLSRKYHESKPINHYMFENERYFRRTL